MHVDRRTAGRALRLLKDGLHNVLPDLSLSIERVGWRRFAPSRSCDPPRGDLLPCSGKLFIPLDRLNGGRDNVFQREALRIYDKRSSLVHDGFLSAAELDDLEGRARTLLEQLFQFAIDHSRPADSTTVADSLHTDKNSSV